MSQLTAWRTGLNLTTDGDFKMDWIIYFLLMLVVISLPLLALLLGLISPFIARFFNWILVVSTFAYFILIAVGIGYGVMSMVS